MIPQSLTCWGDPPANVGPLLFDLLTCLRFDDIEQEDKFVQIRTVLDMLIPHYRFMASANN